MSSDFMLKGSIDLSQAEKDLQKFYTKLRGLQSQAKGAGNSAKRTVALPRELGQSIVNPQVSADAKITSQSAAATRKRNEAISAGTREQAKRVALLEQEYRLAARLAGASKAQITRGVSEIRETGRAGLARSLGKTPDEFRKSDAGKAYNTQVAGFSKEFSGVLGSTKTLKAQLDYLNAQLRSVGIKKGAKSQAIGTADYSDPAPGTVVPPKEKVPRKSRAERTVEAERELIDALGKKTKALNAQTRVLTGKLNQFKNAESDLINALKAKASALGKQAKSSAKANKAAGGKGGTGDPAEDPEEFTPAEKRVRNLEKKKDIANEVADGDSANKSSLLARELVARQGILDAELRIKNQLEVQAALNEKLTAATLEQTTIATAKSNRLLEQQLADPDYVANKKKNRELRQRLSEETDPRAAEKAAEKSQREQRKADKKAQDEQKAQRQASFDKEAEKRNAALLGGAPIQPYKLSQGSKLDLRTEEGIIKAQIAKLSNDEENAGLGAAERQKRAELVNQLNRQLVAARSVANGTAKVPVVRDRIKDFVVDDTKIGRQAGRRNADLLAGRSTGKVYKTSQADKLDYKTERTILKTQEQKLRDEINSGKYSKEEVKARQDIISLLRKQEKALAAVANGTQPKNNPFFKDDAGVEASNKAARKAARDAEKAAEAQAAPDYQSKQDRKAEAARRNARPILTPEQANYGAGTNFTIEKALLAEQRKQLQLNLDRTKDVAQIKALEEQILAVKKLEASLATKQASLIRPDRATGPGSRGGQVPNSQPRTGLFGKTIDKVTRGHQYDSPGSFFGRGALSSVQYGLPSMLLYGAASGIADSIREAEQLQYALSKLQGQVEATFGADSQQIMARFSNAIVETAVDAGLPADALAESATKVNGAFNKRDIGGFEGADLVEEQIRALGKLQRVTGLTAKEIGDDYTAVSLTFGETFDDIGDKIVAVSDVSGVDAGELTNFVGDISAVLKEAGFSLEESLAIGATAAQSSGKGIAAISEAYGRVIPQLSQQTKELNELAAISPTLNTPEFLDAVRLKDSAAVLQIIGEQFNSLSKQSQTAVVSLIGRREAQSILPGLTNQQGYDDTLAAAESSAGSLDQRYALIMENLSVKLAKLGEEIRLVFKKLLEGGLGDFLELLISAGTALTKLFGGIFSVIGEINDLTGGWLGQTLLVVGAMKAMQAVMTKVAALSVVNSVASNFGGAGGGRFTPNFITNAAGAYRTSRFGIGPVGGIGAPLAAGQFGPVAPGAGQALGASKFAASRAAGGSVLASLGGGSALVGGAALGVGVIAGAGLFIKNRMDAANEAIQEVLDAEKAGYDKILAEKDTPEVRETLYSAALKAVDDAKENQSNFNKFLEAVFNQQSEAEARLIQAIGLLYSEDDAEAFTDISSTEPGRNFAQRIFGASNLDNGVRGSVRQDVEDYLLERQRYQGILAGLKEDLKTARGDDKKEIEDSIKEIEAILAGGTGTVETIDPYNPGAAPISKEVSLQSTAEVDRIIKAIDDLGVDTGKLDPALIDLISEAATARNPGQVLNAALEDKKFDDNPEALKQLQDLVKLLTALGGNDPTLQAGLDNLDPTAAIGDAIIDLDKAYEAGQISLTTYAQQKAFKAQQLADQLEIGDEQPTDEAIQNSLAATKEANDAISQAIIARSDAGISLIERFSNDKSDPAILRAKITQLEGVLGSGLLNKDDLNSAVDDWFSAQKDLLQEAIDAAEDPVEKQRLADEGFEIPTYIRVASIGDYLNSIGASWTELNTVFVDFFGVSAQSYLTSIIGAVASGARSEEEVRKELEANLNLAKAALAEASKPVGYRLTAAEKASRQARIDAAQTAVTGLEGLLGGPTGTGGVFGGDSGPNQAGAVDADKQKADEDKTADAKAAYDKAVANRNAVQIAQIEKREAQRKLQEAQSLPAAEKAAAQWSALEAGVRADQALVSAVKNIYDAKVGYLKTVAEVAGNDALALQFEAAKIQSDIRDALAAGDEAGYYAALGAQVQNNDAIRLQGLADKNLDFDLFAATLEFEGDIVNAARTRVAKAQFALDNAVGNDERVAALIELQQAQQTLRQNQATVRDAAYGRFSAEVAGQDPVGQAKVALALAKEQLRDAVGEVEKNNAQKNLIDVQNQLNEAMANARYSQYSLRAAELQAMDEDAAAAQVQAELARQQLNDAIKAGRGEAEINQLRGNLITADRAARDTLFNERLDEYKYLLDMGQITKSQYINYLEALKNTLEPGTDQFKDLELTLRQLKNDIGSDLQANLPTSLALPTLYEVRRIGQIGSETPTAGAAGGIGYQDNRVQDIQITIGQNMSEDQIVTVLSDALGTNRNGYGDRRY